MERISTQEQLTAAMQRQKVLQKEAMSPNFQGVRFSCGCGEQHPAQSTPHVLCGTLNEFFYQCPNGYVTLVKYKGIFRVKPNERWTCPKQIFWDFVYGKRELNAEEASDEMKALSDIVSTMAGVDEETATTYAYDFRNLYLDSIREGQERDFAVAWGAILHVNKMASLENPQSQTLASRAPNEFQCERAEDISIQIAKDATTKLSGTERATVIEALAALEKQ